MREPTKQEIAKFKKATAMLAELGDEGFHLYLAMDDLHLMIGPSHDKHGERQEDLIRASTHIPMTGGGDW